MSLIKFIKIKIQDYLSILKVKEALYFVYQTVVTQGSKYSDKMML